MCNKLAKVLLLFATCFCCLNQLRTQENQAMLQTCDYKLKNVLPNFSKKENLLHISKQMPGFQILFNKASDNTDLEKLWQPKNESLLITSVLDDILADTNYYYRIHTNNTIIVEPYLQWLKSAEPALQQINLGPRHIYKSPIKKHLEHHFSPFTIFGIKYQVKDSIKNFISIETNQLFAQQSVILYNTINEPLFLKNKPIDKNLFQEIQNIPDKKIFGKNKLKMSEWLHLASLVVEQKKKISIDPLFIPLFEEEFSTSSEIPLAELLQNISAITNVQIYYQPSTGLYVEKPYFTSMSAIAQREFRTYFISDLTKDIPFIYIKAKIIELDPKIWKNIEYDIYHNEDLKLLTVCCPPNLMPKIDILLQKILPPAEK